MAMLTGFLLLHLITLFNQSGGLNFDYLNVHEILYSTRRHPFHNPAAAADAAGRRNLSVQLLRRDSIFPTQLHSLSDLLLRDVRRVAAIHRRLSYHPADFTSDIISGVDQGTGEYLVRLGVGSPPVEQYLVLDSGSDVIWLQCQPCSHCYPQSDRLFDPARSASFSPIPHTSPICALLGAAAAATDGPCQYGVSYGDGSYTRGALALETLTFGATAVGEVAIGCGRENGGLFVGAAGLLGLGWGPLSLVGQLGGLAGGSFAYCLPSSGDAAAAAAGEMVFGRSEAVRVGSVWVPLLRNPRAPSFYYVGLTGLGVGGARLAALGEDAFELTEDGGGGAVLDTGTAVTRLPAAAYGALREGFGAAAGLAAAAAPGVSIFDTCYDLGGYGSVRVPTVSLYFEGGTELTLPARNLLIPVDSAGTFCLAFAPSNSGLTILGNIQQQGIRITVDSANGFLGFGPNTC